jgi:ADP-ribose pyrophosphatase YjhB (NUDIX family)
MRERIAETIEAIEPLDELERTHRDSTLEWIRSGAPIFRTAKPDVPPKHLVSYFALIDQQCGKLLLVDHKLAGLWLPSGGHVEPDEDPKATVVRELAEELNLAAEFVRDGPLFITVTRTVGAVGGIPMCRSGICFAATVRARSNSIAASFSACDGSASTKFRSSDPTRTCAASSRRCDGHLPRTRSRIIPAADRTDK